MPVRKGLQPRLLFHLLLGFFTSLVSQHVSDCSRTIRWHIGTPNAKSRLKNGRKIKVEAQKWYKEEKSL